MKQFCRQQPSGSEHHGRQAPRSAAGRLGGDVADPVRALQQNYGNYAAQRLVHEGKISPGFVWYLCSTTENHARQQAITEMSREAPAILNRWFTELTAVQRLPSLEWFKDQTRLRAAHDFRNRVATIDRVLASYHKVDPRQFDESLRWLDRLRDACQAYLQYPDKKAKRKDGVRALLVQVNVEREIFQGLVASQNAQDLSEKFENAFRAQDLAVRAEAQGYEVGKVLDQTGSHLGSVIGEISRDRSEQESQELLKPFIDNDLQRLQDLAENNQTPQLIREILTEILA